MGNKHTTQQLQEQLLAEFDALDKFGRGIGRTVGAGAKTLGSIAGGVAGLGSAIKQGYQAGKQTVGGGGANVNTKQSSKAKPQAKTKAQPQTQTKTTTTKNPQAGFGAALKRFGKGVAGADSYQYRQGTQAQQDASAAGFGSVAQQAADKTTDTTTTKRQKTGGKVAGQTSQSASAQYQRDRRAAKKAGKTAAPKTSTQQTTTTGKQQPTPVPGQNKKTSAVKQGMNQAQTKAGQKQPTKTAQNVGKKTGVNTKNVKAGGVNLDPNNPQQKALIAAINKADPSILKGINAMQPADKAKLKKAIA